MAFPNGNYAPPGVYTQTSYENPTAGLLEGLRLPMFIGTGSEILVQSDLELVRGSSQDVDQRIVEEDETDRAVVSVSQAGAVTLGAFDGARTKIQVRKYPIVKGDGTGTPATKTSAVSVTINGNPIVVLSMVASSGILELASAPKLGDEVRVSYYFKRTDTLTTDDLSDQVTEDGAEIYGALGQPFSISTGDNDTIILTVDDETIVTVTLPDSGASTWTAAQIAAFVNAAASTTTLVATTAEDNFGNTVLYLTADRNIQVGSGLANSTLGLTAGDDTARNKVFYTFQHPIVDGGNGGVTTTDPADVTVKVDGVQVVPTSVDGATGAVTLPIAPESGATVTCAYYFNAWQDTFDYLAHNGVTEITRCGVSPSRSDFTDGVDFVLQNDVDGTSRIVWGTSFLVAAGEHTSGTSYFNSTQVSGVLVDTRGYLQPCSAVVDTSVSPPRESRTKFTLPLVPTTGNGRNSPLGSSLFQTVANDRIDLPTNRPDLVVAYWGFSVQDAIERGSVAVTKVDSATSTVTLKDPVPVGASVWATFYYNTLVDQEYTLSVVTAGASGVGTYSVSNEDGETLYTPKYGTKSSGLSTITLQFPSGSERKPDCRFEALPYGSTSSFTGAVEEDVTVTFASVDGTLGQFTVPGAGDYEIIKSASDHIRLVVDGSALAAGAAGVGLDAVTGGVANLGFAAQMLGAEISYDAASGYTTYEIDSTNNGVNLMVDGVLVSASAAASATGTLASFVTALNTAALSALPEYASAGKFLSATTITLNEYDQLRFHYTGNASGLSGNLVATIAPSAYASVSTLATAIESGIATAVSGLGAAFTGLVIGVNGDGDGRLVFDLTLPTGVEATGTVTCSTVLAGDTVTINGTVFTAVTGAAGANQFDRTPGTDITTATNLVTAINLVTNWVGTPPVVASNVGGTSAIVTITAASVGTGGNAITLASSGATLTVSGATLSGGLNADTSGYLEFITHGTPARDFAVLAGIDTAAATAGAQTKLLNGPIARRFTITGDNTSGLLHDRLVLRSRLIPGFGTVYPFATLADTGIEIQGSTGDALTGITAQATSEAGWSATVLGATLIGHVGFAGGQVATATYADVRDGQPVITFYADGGSTEQNNVFKFTMDGTPVTVEFTDATGAAIASGGSADVPLGPAGTANTVLAQIRAAITAAGISGASSRCVQEGAGIRLYSGLYSSASSIVIGTGNANSILGFDDNESSYRTLVSPKVLASALMGYSAATVAGSLNSWTSPSSTYFAAEALAGVEVDEGGAEYLYLQSQGTAGLGTASSITFATSTADDIMLPTTGLDVVTGDGASGEEGITGFYVTSSDTVNGSGTLNDSLLNGGTGQDGIVGQTYRDSVTGLTFTILPRSGNANYPDGEYFTFTVRSVTTTDSNLPVNTLPGLELLVTNTKDVGVGDTATVETFERGGEEPAIGDLYYVSYEYTKQDFEPALFTKFSTIEARYGALSPDNPVSLAAYLAMLNGAVLIGIKQVQKDTDNNGDGINDAASVDAFRDAIDDLEGPLEGGVLPDILVPLIGSSTTLFQYITKHADIQSDIRHRAERTVIGGVSSGTDVRAVGNIAQAVQRTRFRLVYPDVVLVSLPNADGTDESVLVDGTYLASMLAGSVVSPNTDVATPWTYRRLIGATRLARVLDTVEQNQVAMKGVTVIEDNAPVLRVRHGLTTDMVGNSTNGNPTLSKIPTVIQIVDEVQQQSRNTLDRFIGTKFLPGVLSQIEGQLSNTLKLLVAAQVLSAYTGVRAKISATDPTTAEVEATIAPVFPLLYIVVSFNLRASL